MISFALKDHVYFLRKMKIEETNTATTVTTKLINATIRIGTTTQKHAGTDMTIGEIQVEIMTEHMTDFTATMKEVGTEGKIDNNRYADFGM